MGVCHSKGGWFINDTALVRIRQTFKKQGNCSYFVILSVSLILHILLLMLHLSLSVEVSNRFEVKF